MQLNEENLSGLRNYLQQTLSPDASIRRNAETVLKSIQKQAGFAIVLLQLIEQSPLQDAAIKQAAAIFFKNFVKENWDTEIVGHVISANDRTTIKANIVTLMCTSTDQIQKQLSEALSTISKYDFPQQWSNLLPELISKFHGGDWRVINGVLLTANTTFKRFRYVFKTEELLMELKHCLEQFQAPLLELFSLSVASLNNLGNDLQSVKLVLQALHKMSRIFFSLNWQDIPEYFEDHINEWMKAFDSCLKYRNAALEDADEHDEPSVLDVLQGAIVENLNLYAEKYEEEFHPFLQNFTEITWSLLSNKVTSSPKHDILAAICMKFLKSIGSQQQNKGIFQDNNVLTEICTKIVVANLHLRDSDEELFQDNPMEYIRRDIEGSDSDSRRSASRDLIRGLMKCYEKPVTEICLGLVQSMLQQYASNPSQQWKLKDVSINLIIALAIRKQSKSQGVSELNTMVPIMDFFTTHILPELSEVSSSNEMLKAGAIKFVSTFRNQLNVDMMNSLFPSLIRLLLPSEFVLHTYAASSIERLLIVKDNGNFRFGRTQLAPYLNSILSGIFGILEQPQYPENDYLIKAIMRVLNVAQEDIIPLADLAVSKLTSILAKICANPSNPVFSHYLFESMSVLIRNVCQSNPGAAEQFETLLFPPFQRVLSLDIDLLCPYVYQVLAQLLDVRVQGVSAGYMNMFPVLLTPTLWERVSNVQALEKLLCAYLKKVPNQLFSFLTGILGVFQKLISAKTTEGSAFSLLRAIFGYIPSNEFSQFLSEIFKILMMRLQTRANARFGVVYVKDLIYTSSVFIGKHGPTAMFECIENLQAGMGSMLVQQIWLPHLNEISGTFERKACAIGTIRILCEVPLIFNNKELWGNGLLNVIGLLERSTEESVPLHNYDDALLDLEETGYEAGFSKLHFASHTESDYLKDIQSPKVFLAESLSRLSASQPGQFMNAATNALRGDSLEILKRYIGEAGVTFN